MTRRPQKTGKILIAARYPDQFTGNWDEENKFYLKKLF